MKVPKQYIKTAADRRAVEMGMTWDASEFNTFKKWCSIFALQNQEPWYGKPIELFPFQEEDWFKPLMCWRKPGGIPRFDRAIFTCNKKLGKTTSIAAYAGYRAYCYRRSEILIMSATVRQADLMFQTIVGFKQHPELASNKKWKVKNHLRTLEDLESGSVIRVIAAGMGQVSGPSVDITILDETADFGYAADDTFAKVAFAGAAKPGSLLLSVGNPSDDVNHLAHRLYLQSKAILDSRTIKISLH